MGALVPEAHHIVPAQREGPPLDQVARGPDAWCSMSANVKQPEDLFRQSSLEQRSRDVADDSWDDSRELEDSFSSTCNEWVVALCSISFDLDVGQHVDNCYPADSLSQEEQRDIAFHAFPDSMSMELHSKSSIRDSIFFFRVRRRGELSTGSSPIPDGANQAEEDTNAGHIPAADQEGYEYLYGHVFCRQRQDSSLRRGGEQRSVVVVSAHPYTSVLKPLSQVAGPLFFSYGLEALIQVYSDTCGWPSPTPGTHLQLPVGGLSTISAATPSAALLPSNGKGNLDDLHPILGAARRQSVSGDDTLLPNYDMAAGAEAGRKGSPGQGMFGDVDLYTPLKAVLPKAWTIWEMTLVGEPLLVVATSPSESSSTVAAVASMIAPLPYAGDFRPYFTIHDQQFSQLVSSSQPNDQSASPNLLGITNLYILKVLLSDWPNVLAVGEKPTAAQASRSGGGFGQPSQPETNGGIIGSALKALRRRQQGPLQLMAEHCQMLWTAYQPLTRPDQNLLLYLKDIPAGTDSIKAGRLAANNSATLRRHFEELTTALLLPFKEFILPQLPPERGALPADGPQPLLPFDAEEWLSTSARSQAESVLPVLSQRLGSPKAVTELLRRFVLGSNFMPWLQRQQAAAVIWRDQEWEAAAALRRTSPIACMDEVEMVEALNTLDRRLEAVTNRVCPSDQDDALVQQLQQELFMLFEAMPVDLQCTLLSSPMRAAQIQSLIVARDNTMPLSIE